jgi:diadenosine tetraphosphate (Ap4A) HIT family hydrolase
LTPWGQKWKSIPAKERGRPLKFGLRKIMINKEMFKLHEQLKKDTILIKDLDLCQILLMNNSLYPWFILVPKKPDLIEIIDLSDSDQKLLMEEISLFSKIVNKVFVCDKLNIAALGNMVPQLHIHIIARFKGDPTFPKPVWVSDECVQYDKKDLENIISNIKECLSKS